METRKAIYTSAETCTHRPCDNELARASTDGADVLRISIGLLRQRGAKSRSERAALALAERVASDDAERVVGPRLETHRRRVLGRKHARSFDELVRLVERSVVVDDVLQYAVVVVTSRRPLDISAQRPTLGQSHVVRPVRTTCINVVPNCHFYCLITFVVSELQ